MILRGWMVMMFGAVLGAIAVYFAFAFIVWDWWFFLPSNSEPFGRAAYLFMSLVAANFGVIPFIGRAVDIDMRNRKRL